MGEAAQTGEGRAALAGRAVLVAGGTGNVGRHVVRALLDHGATVVVPSRSVSKLEALRASARRDGGRLVTMVGDIANEDDAARLRDEALQRSDTGLTAAVASLGRWIGAPSLLRADRAALVEALENYVVAHFVVARTFLPVLAGPDASYTLINGPSAFATWPGSALVSIATAAQAMLARALADEVATHGTIRLTELVTHPSSYIGPDAESGGGPIDGAAVGRCVASIVAGQRTGSPTLHLRDPEQAAVPA